MRILALLCCLLLCSCSGRVYRVLQQLPVVQSEMNLPEDEEPKVIVFLDPDCPISQYVVKPLNKLQSEFQDYVEVIGVIPGTYYSKAELYSFVVNFQLDFLVLLDSKLALVNRLDATITPETFLIDSSGKVLYQGALDDKYERLGKARPLPNQEYLESALSQFSTGKAISSPMTTAIGCIIERQSD